MFALYQDLPKSSCSLALWYGRLRSFNIHFEGLSSNSKYYQNCPCLLSLAHAICYVNYSEALLYHAAARVPKLKYAYQCLFSFCLLRKSTR